MKHCVLARIPVWLEVCTNFFAVGVCSSGGFLCSGALAVFAPGSGLRGVSKGFTHLHLEESSTVGSQTERQQWCLQHARKAVKGAPTVTLEVSTKLLLKWFRALFASSSDLNPTKPNLRNLPSLVNFREQSVTVPKAANIDLNLSSFICRQDTQIQENRHKMWPPSGADIWSAYSPH